MRHLKFLVLGIAAKIAVFAIVSLLNVLLVVTENSPLVAIGGAIIVLATIVGEMYFMGKGLSK